MRKMLVAVSLLFGVSAFSAGEAEVVGASYISDGHKVSIDVRYQGGCKEHSFELDVTPQCLFVFPTECTATLVHTQGSDNPCKMRVFKTLTFSLPEETPRGALLDIISGESKVRVALGELPR